MPIEVQREPANLGAIGCEPCFRCTRVTPYWFTPRDVPCCLKCAAVVDADDVPSKEAWAAVTALPDAHTSFKALSSAYSAAWKRDFDCRSRSADADTGSSGISMPTWAIECPL